MLDPQFEQDLKNAGVTIEQFRKMTMRQRLDLKLPKRDWREGWLGDTDIPSHPEVPDVTIGFHKNLPAQPPEDEDEEVTIARAKREKAAQDLVIQSGAAPWSNQGRVVDLAAVQIRDRQHRSIADRIEDLLRCPRVRSRPRRRPPPRRRSLENFR